MAQARRFSRRRLEKALNSPVACEFLDEQALANLEMVDGNDPVQVAASGQMLRLSTTRGSYFARTISQMLYTKERARFLDARLIEFALSAPPKFHGSESAGLSKALLNESFKADLKVDFREREKRAFPATPAPAWLRRQLLPAIEPLVRDEIIKPKYWTWLCEGIASGKKRAGTEAWQLFTLACWYQANIRRTDPFAQAE